MNLTLPKAAKALQDMIDNIVATERKNQGMW